MEIGFPIKVDDVKHKGLNGSHQHMWTFVPHTFVVIATLACSYSDKNGHFFPWKNTRG